MIFQICQTFPSKHSCYTVCCHTYIGRSFHARDVVLADRESRIDEYARMVMVEVEIILLTKGRKKLEKVDIESLTQGGQYLFQFGTCVSYKQSQCTCSYRVIIYV